MKYDEKSSVLTIVSVSSPFQIDFKCIVCYPYLAPLCKSWGRFGFDGDTGYMVSEPQFRNCVKSRALNIKAKTNKLAFAA